MIITWLQLVFSKIAVLFQLESHFLQVSCVGHGDTLDCAGVMALNLSLIRLSEFTVKVTAPKQVSLAKQNSVFQFHFSEDQ